MAKKILKYMTDEQAHAEYRQYFCSALQGILSRGGFNTGTDAVRLAWDLADEAVAQSHERPSLSSYLKERLGLD